MHGTSKYIQTDEKLFGKAEFMDFAPAPCDMCSCLAPPDLKGRQYAKVFDNRVEFNFPCAPFACLTCSEKCTIDRPGVIFHDRPPSRAGMCCWVIPCTCCGPPVVYVQKPVCCCCIDCTSHCGETINMAPCNFFGLKKFLCCGGPCYMSCGSPLFPGVKDGKNFLVSWSAALNDYFKKTGLDIKEKAIFEAVKDSEIDQYSAQKISS